MKKSFSLLTVAVMALGIVAFCAIDAKAEAQGLTNFGLRFGYNANEMETITPYRYYGYTYYDTTYSFSDYGGHLAAYAEIALATIDLGTSSDMCVVGLTPALQLSWTGSKIKRRTSVEGDTINIDINMDIGALYLDAFLPVSFRWPTNFGYALIVEVGAFGKFLLFGDTSSDIPTIIINDVELMKFDAGVMAGVVVEVGNIVSLGYRITSGFMQANVYSHYLSLGFNIWRK